MPGVKPEKRANLSIYTFSSSNQNTCEHTTKLACQVSKSINLYMYSTFWKDIISNSCDGNCIFLTGVLWSKNKVKLVCSIFCTNTGRRKQIKLSGLELEYLQVCFQVSYFNLQFFFPMWLYQKDLFIWKDQNVHWLH